jgi:hypothetical protein
MDFIILDELGCLPFIVTTNLAFGDGVAPV